MIAWNTGLRCLDVNPRRQSFEIFTSFEILQNMKSSQVLKPYIVILKRTKKKQRIEVIRIQEWKYTNELLQNFYSTLFINL